MSIRPNNYCALLCRDPRRLRLINSHPTVVDLVRRCLEESGLKFEFYQNSNVTCAFKFSKHLFRRRGLTSEEDGIKIRNALANIVAEMSKINWEVDFSTDIGRHLTNSCIFFTQNLNPKEDASGNVFTFAPSGTSKALLINVPDGIENQIVDGIKKVIKISDPEKLDTKASRIEMSSFAWYSTGDSAISIRQMLLRVIEIAQANRYELVTNLDIKGTTDCMMFQYTESLSGSSQKLMMISLNGTDKMRLISAPTEVISTIEGVINDFWHRGLQDSKVKEGCHQFKLKGNPWWTHGEETVESRFLIGNLIAKMKSIGWEVLGTLDVSRKLQDKSVFVFRQCAPEVKPYAVLSFHETDKIRFQTNSPSSEHLSSSIEKVLEFADKIQSKSEYGRAIQWKINGRPFSGSYGRGAEQRLMIHLLSKVLSFFKDEGWRVVASADVSAKYHKDKNSQYPLDNHSWFFLQDPGPEQSGNAPIEELLIGDTADQIKNENEGICTIM